MLFAQKSKDFTSDDKLNALSIISFWACIQVETKTVHGSH